MQLSETRQKYASMATSSAPLEDQKAESRILEAKLREYEETLERQSRHGDAMLEHDPRVTLPIELCTLHSHWLELQQKVCYMSNCCGSEIIGYGDGENTGRFML